MEGRTVTSRIDLYWLPLGAGGWFVKFNGRVYERILSWREGRDPFDLYHTALIVTLPEGSFVIENAWPIPDADLDARGVTVQGPVWSSLLGRFRVFRYEVRRWADGTIADIDDAVASPHLLSTDERSARSVLDLTEQVPVHLWGRDQARIGDMWNSNSVISWLLATAGLPAGDISAPSGGRAPGWRAGVEIAEQMAKANVRAT